MTQEQLFKNLNRPEGKIDVVLDTDAYNEIDDQFAISYMLKHSEKLNVKGICAAPFKNARSVSPADGMRKSYNEILKLLKLAGEEKYSAKVFKGSDTYLPDENTAVDSEASDFIAELANGYSNDNPLYIVAIGAITNVASAIIKNPEIKEKAVIVWLGGHAQHIGSPVGEFNMVQDIAAARVVYGCGVPLVQLPCVGVVDSFATSKYELEHWLKGKNKLCDYLLESAVNEAESYAAGKPWTRVIWDVTAIAWLIDTEGIFMRDRLIRNYLPEYDLHYAENPDGHFMKYVYKINRDALFEDLFRRLAE